MKYKIWCEDCGGEGKVYYGSTETRDLYNGCPTCEGKGYTDDKNLVELDPDQSLPKVLNTFLSGEVIGEEMLKANFRKVKL